MQVLIVEDDAPIRRMVRDGLTQHGIDVAEAGTVAAALTALASTTPDVVILDLTLPDGSGIGVLEHLAAAGSTIHVIVLSGAIAEQDRVRALELGADDYVVKPFYTRELTARVQAVRRRIAADTDRVLHFGAIEVDLDARRLLVDSVDVHLTAKEFELLAFLAVRPGHVFSRKDLLRTVWQSAPDWQSAATVTEHVRRLRQKVEVDPAHPRLIRTARGAGYQFVPPAADLRQRALDRAATTTTGVTISLDGRVVHADDIAARLFGFAQPADLVGKRAEDLVSPQSRAATKERRRLMAAGHAPRSQILVMTRSDGGEVPLEVTTSTVEWHGRAAIRTQLKEVDAQEVRLRRLVTGVLSEVTDAVIVTDMQFHIRSWNGAAERLFGWTETEVLGRHILDIVEWVDENERQKAAWAQLEESDRWHGEGSLRARDGSVLAVLASINIVRDEAGDAVGVVSVNRLVRPDAVAPSEALAAEDVLDLRRGLEHGELVVHYQPVLDLESRRIIALEALVRWQHPVRGLLLPGAFIDTAERSGLIVDLGRYVLERACHQTAAWRREGHDVYVTVNLSAQELSDPGLVDRVTATTDAAGLDRRSLWLEVTETGLVEDVEQASVVLHQLTALGVGIAIDDFGTGWASLTYLRRFPIHALKVDCTFVSGVDHDAGNLAIVRSILMLGAELDLAVVAEGIETEAEAETLRALGCRVGQGFLYGHATPANQVEIDRTLSIPAAASVGR